MRILPKQGGPPFLRPRGFIMPIIAGRWRTAFTLKELMALVTILAVAFGIASPWVQRQREAARRFPLDGGGDSLETVSGIFSNRDFFCKLSHITDGLSNTFFFGEVLFNCGAEQPWVWHPQTITSGRCTTTIPLNIFATCYHAPAKQVGVFSACGRWDDSTNAGARCKALYQGSRSRHPGEANFVMADASLHFVSETIDERTYRCLGDREDGNTLNVPIRF